MLQIYMFFDSDREATLFKINQNNSTFREIHFGNRFKTLTLHQLKFWLNKR